MFREWEYSESNGHALDHIQIHKELQKMKGIFVPYSQDTSWVNTGETIKNMLINHRLVDDMKFIDYYKSKITNARRE